MPLSRLLRLVSYNLLRNKKNLVFSSVGIVVGVTLFSFFLALAGGIKERVLNRVYPINQVEIEPETVTLAGFQSDLPQRGRLDAAAVKELGALPGVTHAFPKQRSKLPSMFKGGRALFGHERYFEAFFDGLAPSLLWEELAEREDVSSLRRRHAGREPVPCAEDGDCKPGYECLEAACRAIEYWRHFRYGEQRLPCTNDRQCLVGESCLAGRCERPCSSDGDCVDEALRCASAGRENARVCAYRCANDGDCPRGQACGDDGACRPQRCRLADARAQQADSCLTVRGRIEGDCEGEGCPWQPCPDGSYCAADNATSARGTCELPVPVVLSPFLLEMYNAVAGPQMGTPRLDFKAMVGVEMRMAHGESLITRDMRSEDRIIKRVRLVGFSDKALDLGVTTPLTYVRRVNAHYRGRGESERYDTIVLQTQGNEDVSGVTLGAEDRGFTLSRKSRDARKAGTMLFILTGLFTFISAVILVIAAVNITHTFLMIVYERKHEIGIQRAVGAKRWDIRKLILAEAAVIGLGGGLVGNTLAYGLAGLTNKLSAAYLSGIPFRPENLFVFSPAIVAASVGFALLFCVIGAFFPANRAAGLEPAEVLSMK